MEKGAHDPTKARLLEAAGEEFAEKGFELATVRSICQRAGTNVAAINYHFGDKEQLYVQAVFEAHRCSTRPVPAFLDPAEPAAEQLRRFIHYFLEMVLSLDGSATWHNTLMMREMLRPTSACEALVREAIRPRFERLRAILHRLWPEADARRLDALCFSVIGQCLHYRMARSVTQRLIGEDAFRALDAEYLSDHITAFCLAALGQGPPLPRREGSENAVRSVEAGGAASPLAGTF